MKKSSYTLIAFLVICLAAIGYLVFEKAGDQRQLKLLNAQIEDLNKNLDALRIEKLAWENEKSRVAQSLGSVQGVLRSTLDELDVVVESIGKSLSTKSPGILETGEPEPDVMTASPYSGPSPSMIPSPAAKETPSDKVPLKATSSPKAVTPSATARPSPAALTQTPSI